MRKQTAEGETGCLTLRHAFEDMQKTHEEVLDLIAVQFVTAEDSAAQS